MENYELYRLAENELMNHRAREEEINEITKKEYGRENRIAVFHMNEIDKKLEWLHEQICNIENAKN